MGLERHAASNILAVEHVGTEKANGFIDDVRFVWLGTKERERESR